MKAKFAAHCHWYAKILELTYLFPCSKPAVLEKNKVNYQSERFHDLLLLCLPVVVERTLVLLRTDWQMSEIAKEHRSKKRLKSITKVKN